MTFINPWDELYHVVESEDLLLKAIEGQITIWQAAYEERLKELYAEDT